MLFGLIGYLYNNYTSNILMGEILHVYNGFFLPALIKKYVSLVP